MDSAKLSDWLTVLANLGIVAGLVIVYLELDHANRLAEANAHQFREAEITKAQIDYALSDYMPEIVIKARESGFDSLTAVESSRYLMWESARRQRLVGAYRQYQMGFIDRQTIDLNFRAITSNGWAVIWDELGMIPNHSSNPFWQELEKIREAEDAN